MIDRVVNFMREVLREHLPRVAYADGTGVFDLFIHAFARIANGIFSLIDQASISSDVTRYDDLTEDQMDAAGAFFFLPRSDGGYARTVQRIYLRQPARIVIPAGWRVGGQYLFQTTERLEFGASRVSSQTSGGMYYIQFTVQAIQPGASYNVEAGTITDLKDPLYANWISTTNIVAASGGADHEDNEEYFERLDDSINTRNLLITKGSVRTTLMALFPTITDMSIVGYGDEGMDRDIYYGLSGPGGAAPYFTSNYLFKNTGSLSPCPNSAFKFITEVALPDLEDVEEIAIELSNEEYREIGANDLVHFVHYASRLWSDDFPSTTPDYKVADWLTSDSGLPYGQKRYADSVYEKEGLRLGKTPANIASETAI